MPRVVSGYRVARFAFPTTRRDTYTTGIAPYKIPSIAPVNLASYTAHAFEERNQFVTDSSLSEVALGST